MNIGIISLGCCKNRVDTEVMIGILKKSGHRMVNALDQADAIIVNTCGFINDAKEEAIKTILDTGKMKNTGRLRFLIAAGCMSQRYGRELLDEMPELDGVVGVSCFDAIDQVIDEVAAGATVVRVQDIPPNYGIDVPRVLTTPAGSAYLKIAEGCDNRCSYCAIPLIRGQLRSKPMDNVVDEAVNLSQRGVKELVLIAQDTAAYGMDLYGKKMLPELLPRIEAIDGIEWIRLMYVHPAHLDDQLIGTMRSSSKIIPYLDLPVQHVSSHILRGMNRKHDKKHLEDLLARVKQDIPGLVLRTTVMVGFPGEEEDDFEQLMDFVNKIRFDWLGVFKFDAEEGTTAYSMPGQVSDDIKQRRYQLLMQLQKNITRDKNIARINQVMPVLISSHLSQSLYIGRTYFQAPEVDGLTVVKSDIRLKPGEMVDVRIKGVREYDTIGEIAHEST
ncbi:MAG TPA: 30S ribosomal protein S12 methylthiotransferase RimO [Syntrophomonas sp.]|nr:30S ribosomal protein S12 methylthiotransferase RimO [Syntrophomonas sp.]HCF72073.1 30S ribosomal protein S12 methylthiotransferase RimO [Syntrophomonas sp.]